MMPRSVYLLLAETSAGRNVRDSTEFGPMPLHVTVTNQNKLEKVAINDVLIAT